MASAFDTTMDNQLTTVGAATDKPTFKAQFDVVKTEINHGGFSAHTPANYAAPANDQVTSHLAAIDVAIGSAGGGVDWTVDQGATDIHSANLAPNLTVFAGLSGVADRLAYFTGMGAMALATFTAFGRSLVAAADAAAARTLTGAAGLVAPVFTGLMKVEAVKGTGEAKSANYSVVAGDSGKLLTATAALTIDLPAVATLCPNVGDLFRLDVHNDSGGVVILNGPGATNMNLATGEWGTVYARNGGKMVSAKGATTVLS